MTFREWLKAHHPKMRRAHPVGLLDSGKGRRLYKCLCGASITMSTKYPMTKRVKVFIDLHNITCLPLECAEGAQ